MLDIIPDTSNIFSHDLDLHTATRKLESALYKLFHIGFVVLLAFMPSYWQQRVSFQPDMHECIYANLSGLNIFFNIILNLKRDTELLYYWTKILQNIYFTLLFCKGIQVEKD